MRIEKSAYTMARRGHELLFIGGRKAEFQNIGAFSETHHLPIRNNLYVVFSRALRRRWADAVRRLDPDIVHAHNVIVAMFIHDLGVPTVYDDHEYWSQRSFLYRTKKLPRGFASWPLMLKIPHYEDMVLRKFPTLTINESIANDHRQRCPWVGVTPNVPRLVDVEGLPMPDDRNGIVYIGGDFKLSRFVPHRDMTGLRQYLKFDVVTGLPYRGMMERLTHYRVGLTPFRQHPFHRYCSSNKTYEYLHAGLQAVVTDSLFRPFTGCPYVYPFHSYAELQTMIDNLPDESPEDIMHYAREHYTWERFEPVIVKAYDMAKKLCA